MRQMADASRPRSLNGSKIMNCETCGLDLPPGCTIYRVRDGLQLAVRVMSPTAAS